MVASWIGKGLKGKMVVGAVSSLVTLALVASGMALTGVGFAAGGSDTIHGCVVKHVGFLRVVGNPSECKKHETPIEWNKQGPPGPPASLTINKRTAHGVIAPHSWDSVTSLCEPGEVVTGGGFSIGSIGFNDKLNVNGPVDGPSGTVGWMISLHNDTENSIHAWVTAMCAASAP